MREKIATTIQHLESKSLSLQNVLIFFFQILWISYQHVRMTRHSTLRSFWVSTYLEYTTYLVNLRRLAQFCFQLRLKKTKIVQKTTNSSNI